jgi:hypothetical protein
MQGFSYNFILKIFARSNRFPSPILLNEARLRLQQLEILPSGGAFNVS